MFTFDNNESCSKSEFCLKMLDSDDSKTIMIEKTFKRI